MIALSSDFGPTGSLAGFCLAFQGYCRGKDEAVFKTVTFRQRSCEQHAS